jgi:DMSO/TMAO reductase YedYZ heme-binding membrane subunit
LILSSAAMQAGLTGAADLADAWGRAARWTARVGLPLFLIAYSASSLGRLWPNRLTRAVWRDRRWWGLGFAASHAVHLYALVMALEASGEQRTVASLVPGGIAYLFILLMALTSNDAAMRMLGRNWKRLHSLGIHYIWLVYTLAYAGRLFDAETRPEAIYGVSLSLAALGLRLAARRKAAGIKPRPSPAEQSPAA